ncbi:type II toxin-antitoxin system RelE/ParE family toxin [Desulfovibrio sp. OttesenSCG-928-O18]|nr:type II toxin-antitoxin system RelE/ParE family toxin [Desulfovibrio sp. OttesenSCG-928-O18]
MPSGATVRVRWLRAANRNLDAAANYVAKEDPDAAQEMYAHIRGRVAELAKRPEMGRPGRVFGTRELVIERYPYIVPYRIRGREVQIIRVFHTSQRPPEAW